MSSASLNVPRLEMDEQPLAFEQGMDRSLYDRTRAYLAAFYDQQRKIRERSLGYPGFARDCRVPSIYRSLGFICIGMSCSMPCLQYAVKSDDVYRA
jgi:hypothetical protein